MKISKIGSLIHVVRGQRVILDADLAALYGVTTGNLNKSVRRNSSRFPSDFMFQLTDQELEGLIFQFGRSNEGRGGSRFRPFAFTEHGVAMLSSVLNSERAVSVNIEIMRAFIRLRSALLASKELGERVFKLEQTQGSHEMELGEHAAQINDVFAAIRDMGMPRKRKRGRARPPAAPVRGGRD